MFVQVTTCQLIVQGCLLSDCFTVTCASNLFHLSSVRTNKGYLHSELCHVCSKSCAECVKSSTCQRQTDIPQNKHYFIHSCGFGNLSARGAYVIKYLQLTKRNLICNQICGFIYSDGTEQLRGGSCQALCTHRAGNKLFRLQVKDFSQA